MTKAELIEKNRELRLEIETTKKAHEKTKKAIQTYKDELIKVNGELKEEKERFKCYYRRMNDLAGDIERKDTRITDLGTSLHDAKCSYEALKDAMANLILLLNEPK